MLDFLLAYWVILSKLTVPLSLTFLKDKMAIPLLYISQGVGEIRQTEECKEILIINIIQETGLLYNE